MSDDNQQRAAEVLDPPLCEQLCDLSLEIDDDDLAERLIHLAAKVRTLEIARDAERRRECDNIADTVLALADDLLTEFDADEEVEVDGVYEWLTQQAKAIRSPEYARDETRKDH